MTNILLSIIWFVSVYCRCQQLQMYSTLQDFHTDNPSETPGHQILMTDEARNNGAYCLDGSVPDFYYRAGYGDGVNKFNFYLQGGGWCANIDSCVARTTTNLGSSKFDSQYMNIAGGAPYLSSNRTVNPLAYNWNTVYIRYCDGSSYSSNNETIFVYNSTTTLHFRGWRILNGVINVLFNKYNLSQATDILLTGCSAGALGVYFHADYFYQHILELKKKNNNNEAFNYMSMPDAGYFMEVGAYIVMMEFNYAYGNLTGSLNQNCVNFYMKNNLNVIECMYAVNIAPFISTKMFAVQSQYDSNQLAHLNTNNTVLINQYGHNLTYWFIDRFINTSVNKHFGWLVSCEEHCIFSYDHWMDITIDGYTVSQAQMNAWVGKDTSGNLLFQNKTYPCNSCCS